MDIIELLDSGYDWTGQRIATATAADLLAPTPGSEVSIGATEDVDDWRTLDSASRWARIAAASLAPAWTGP